VRYDLQLPFGLNLIAPKLKEIFPATAKALALANDDEPTAEAAPDVEPLRLADVLENAGGLPPLTACLGLTDDACPLLLRLTSPGAAQVLVAGEDGEGKTELLRTLLISLALRSRQRHLQMALLDSRARGFAPLAGLPHLITDVAADPRATRGLLERLERELDRRDAAGFSEPHIIVAVDEIMDALEAGGSAAEDLLARVTRFGREAGVHLLAGTSQPAAALEALPTARFSIRLVGRLTNGADAEAAAGRPGSGVEELLGRGDFFCLAGGPPVPFQAAWVSASDWAEFAAQL
jgi:S-DNA-T family DNA segregation ATPase FtsK/SpoIIIE